VRKARSGFKLPRLDPIDWPVRDFALICSVTGPDGSVYEVMQRWD
jgi:2'-5' RNA ligase